VNMLDRIMQRVSPEALTGCWLWTGDTGKHGYGVVTERVNGRRIAHRAHRLVYTLTKGPIPEGYWVRHSCDTPACVAPHHLTASPPRENVLDTVRRGRHRNQNTGRMTCRAGHSLTGENVKLERTGFRRCILCQQTYHRNYLEKK
jgi:hypothetical protein